MSTALQFAILGLASGALYVLLSLGLVIVHRASGVVNYAQGAIGMVGTYVFWELNQTDHLPYGLAVVVGMAVSAAIGALTHLMVMRPLRGAAPITRMIATLGVLTVLEQSASRIFSATTRLIPSELPTSTVTFFGATVGVNYIIIIGVVLVTAGVLTSVYRWTNFGRFTSATAENRRALAALGVSPDRVAVGNWAVAGALGAGAGILLAPLTGLSVTEFTLLVLPALAGAVVGRLNSFPLTVVGGLVIGIVQSEMSRYIHTNGWSSAAPFIVIVVVLVIRGRDEGLRSSSGERLPLLGNGRVRWQVVVPGIIVSVLAIQLLNANWVDAVTTTLTAAIILLSLVVVTGYSGQLSLGQLAFAGWGAWVAGRLVASGDLSFLPALVVAVVTTIPVGLVVGAVCLRTRGTNLSILTLAFVVGMTQILFSNPTYTGGPAGITVGFPHVFGLDVDAVLHTNRYAELCLVLFVVAALGVANLRRGRSGRRIVAVRANERAAASLGINVAGARMYAFCLASVIASLGGVLLAFRTTSIIYSAYTALSSIQLVAQAVVGGIGWIFGSVLGGLLQVGSLGTQVLNLFGTTVGGIYLPLIAGALLIATILAAPDGLAYQNWRQGRAVVQRFGLAQRRARPPRRAGRVTRGPASAGATGAAGRHQDVPAPAPAAPPASSTPGADHGPVAEGRRQVKPAPLLLENVGVRYGGVVALDDVSLRVDPGEVVGLIGPNGAGKTTLVDAVTGFVHPSGHVLLEGRDITGWQPARMSRAGVARSFQSLELFEDMTVLDNLRVASEPRDRASYLADLVFPRTPPLSAAALTTIEELQLGPDLSKRPSELPYGRRRQVGIGRAVATAPSVLMLDEPAAGLDDDETAELSSLIRSLASNWGMGILLIEHDVEMVMATCDRIYALNFGRLIANGTPAEIREDPAVIASYLGVSRSVTDAPGTVLVGDEPVAPSSMPS